MRVPIRLAAWATTSLILLFEAAAPAAPVPRLRLPPGVDHVKIPLRPCGGAVAAQVLIDGRDAGWFVVDTGASQVALDTRVASGLGISSLGTSRWGRQIALIGTVEVNQAGFEPSAGCLFTMPWLASTGDPAIPGLLGNSFLREVPFTIDYAQLTLTLFNSASFKAPAGAAGPFQFEIEHGLPLLPAMIEDHPARLMLDTGLRDEPVVLRNLVARFPELVRGKSSVPQTSLGAGGVVPGRFFSFASFQLLGRTWGPLRASVPDEGKYPFGVELPSRYDGIVGGEQLLDARITFDYASRRLWVEWPALETADAMARRLESRFHLDVIATSPLLHAVIRRRSDVVRILLSRNANPERQNLANRTPLTQAAINGDLATVSALLAGGTGPDVRALSEAALCGDTEIIAALLKGGTQLESGDKSAITPLGSAACGGHVAAVRALLDAGADIDSTAANGSTPLAYACTTTEDAIATLLVERGARIDTPDTEGVTPLIQAARYRRLSLVRLLLDRGAAVNHIDKRGRTALIEACRYGASVELVRLLLNRGADPKVADLDRKTAADYALDAEQLDLLDVLPPPGPAKPVGPATRPAPTSATKAAPSRS